MFLATRRQCRFGRSAGLTDRETSRAINVQVLNRVNPQMEAMISLNQPPRCLQRRMSVETAPVLRPNIIQRRNSVAAIQYTVPDPPPTNRSQILHELGMESLLYLDESDSDGDVRSHFFLLILKPTWWS